MTIVGLIVSVEQTTVKISIQIDDQTGVIDCINYTGADAVVSLNSSNNKRKICSENELCFCVFFY